MYAAGERDDYTVFPENYLGMREQALLNEYRERLESDLSAGRQPTAFPEALITGSLDNTWHDTAEAVVGNWMGIVYQLTHRDRRIPFMDGVDPENPLNL